MGCAASRRLKEAQANHMEEKKTHVILHLVFCDVSRARPPPLHAPSPQTRLKHAKRRRYQPMQETYQDSTVPAGSFTNTKFLLGQQLHFFSPTTTVSRIDELRKQEQEFKQDIADRVHRINELEQKLIDDRAKMEADVERARDDAAKQKLKREAEERAQPRRWRAIAKKLIMKEREAKRAIEHARQLRIDAIDRDEFSEHNKSLRRRNSAMEQELTEVAREIEVIKAQNATKAQKLATALATKKNAFAVEEQKLKQQYAASAAELHEKVAMKMAELDKARNLARVQTEAAEHAVLNPG